jgi:hypothetical protein
MHIMCLISAEWTNPNSIQQLFTLVYGQNKLIHIE